MEGKRYQQKPKRNTTQFAILNESGLMISSSGWGMSTTATTTYN